jgi:protein ImuB
MMPPTTKHRDRQPSAKLALRRFRPAIPARVEVSAEQAPVWIGFSRRKGRVLHASGPWRSSGDWWDAAGEWKRDEWDVHITLDGCAALYRVFRDLTTRGWFVDGVYD